MPHSFRCLPIAATVRLVQVPRSGGDQVLVPSGKGVITGLSVVRSQAFIIECDAPALVSFARAAGTNTGKLVYASVQAGSWACEVPDDMNEITVDSTVETRCSVWDPSTANQPPEDQSTLLVELLRKIAARL